MWMPRGLGWTGECAFLVVPTPTVPCTSMLVPPARDSTLSTTAPAIP